MPKKLRRLKISEVSAVDVGANPGAQIMLVKRGDPGAVTFRKRDTGEIWTLPGDIDSLPALIAAAPGWGIEIVTDAAPPPAADIAKEANMDPHDEMIAIAKNYDETGELAVEITKADVYGAMVRSAEKARLPGQSAARAFARYIESAEGSSMFRLHKAASGSDVPATPVFTSSYQKLEWERAQTEKSARAAAADRESAAQSSINEMVRSFFATGQYPNEAAARRAVMGTARARSLLAVRGVYRTTAA
jgi:hypothetical protein